MEPELQLTAVGGWAVTDGGWRLGCNRQRLGCDRPEDQAVLDGGPYHQKKRLARLRARLPKRGPNRPKEAQHYPKRCQTLIVAPAHRMAGVVPSMVGVVPTPLWSLPTGLNPPSTTTGVPMEPFWTVGDPTRGVPWAILGRFGPEH